MLMIRLCPLIPFTYFNYVISVTSVSLYDYVAGGFGMIPGIIAYVFVGTTLGSLKDAAAGDDSISTVNIVFMVAGSIIGVAAIIYISIVVKRILNETIEQ